MYILLFLIIWTLSSITWFLKNLGNKYRKEQWYDYLLYPPMLGICHLISFFNRKN
jgi:hypothetical protein